MKKIKEHIDFVTKILAVYVGLSYAFGFLVWSIYLQFLGFYPNLFQGRYVLTGTTFFLVALILFGLFLVLKDFFTKLFFWFFKKEVFVFQKGTDLSKFSIFYFFVIIFALYLFIFSLFVFPYIPGFLGGNEPKLVAIIAEEQEISYLEDFGVARASSFQTGIVCGAYEDDKYIVLILNDRILSLKKDLYKGFVSLPNKDEKKYVRECNATIISNVMKWRTLNFK